MLEGLKNYIFLIIDQENKGLLEYTYSASVANAVSKGISNSSVMLAPIANFDKSVIENYGNNFRNNYKLVRKDITVYTNSKMMTSECNVCEVTKDVAVNKVFDLRPLVVSESWIEKRKLTAFRVSKLKILETTCDRYLTRFKTFTGDSFFHQYISKQLDITDIENEKFAPAIIEWADINGMSPKASYYDLKMKYDSAGISVVRVNAIWNKYSDMINAVNDKQEFEKLDIISRAEIEFRFGEKQ
jgi:hypothetical protein